MPDISAPSPEPDNTPPGVPKLRPRKPKKPKINIHKLAMNSASAALGMKIIAGVEFSKDLRELAKTLTQTEVRFLVDLYYQIQGFRIASGEQIRSMSKSQEPINLLGSVFLSFEKIENEIRRWLDIFSDTESTGMGLWAKSICGIGPVISSGLLAHVDITLCPTAGHIWRFAGLDPTSKWEKKTKRPWNASLKVLCYKLGECFFKVQNNSKDTYGKLFVQRKEYERQRNDAGLLADQAKAALAAKDYGKDTDAYQWYMLGKLPPAHIHARARRWTTKIFLSHWHAEAYRRHFGAEPPAPYPIAILGHAHKIEGPQ